MYIGRRGSTAILLAAGYYVGIVLAVWLFHLHSALTGRTTAHPEEFWGAFVLPFLVPSLLAGNEYAPLVGGMLLVPGVIGSLAMWRLFR